MYRRVREREVLRWAMAIEKKEFKLLPDQRARGNNVILAEIGAYKSFTRFALLVNVKTLSQRSLIKLEIALLRTIKWKKQKQLVF